MLAFAGLAMVANAQFVVGGSLGFATNNGDINYTGVAPTTNDFSVPTNTSMTNYMNYSILPKIGYQLNDKMQVGLSFGIEGGSYKDYSMWRGQYMTYNDFEGWVKTSYKGFAVAPYFRYNLMEIKGFTLFCEAQLSLYFGARNKIHEYNTAIDDQTNFYTLPANDVTRDGNFKTNSLRLSVVPGLNYKISENFSADLYIDLLRLSYDRITNIQYDNYVAGDKFVEHDNTFRFGANMNAQTLTNHLGNFRLGFNYHF